MRLFLFAFGKLKTPGLREAADYYSRMIQPWAPLEQIELRPIPIPDKSPATRARVQERESALLTEKLAARLSKRGVFYLLDESGRQLPTREWGKLAGSWEEQGIPEIALCIGSSLGFSSELRQRARGVLGLGPHTLSHELARVVLLEQTYRALSVLRGHPYHNEG